MTDTRSFLLVGLLVTVVVAAGVSQLASSSPDGLEYVAERQGIDETERDHTFADFALADYGENLSDNDALNTAVAGLVGVLATLAVGYLAFRLVVRREADA